jgi:hypothetical protein
MQPLNYDMDDLMRRAAADYPVIPQGADWEKVAQQLQATDKSGTEKQRYGLLRKLLLIVPFLLAGFVCDRFFKQEHGDLNKFGTGERTHSIDKDTQLPVAKKQFQTSKGVYVKSNKNIPQNRIKKNVAGIKTYKNKDVANSVKKSVVQDNLFSPHGMGFLKSSLPVTNASGLPFFETGLPATAVKTPAPSSIATPLHGITLPNKTHSRSKQKSLQHEDLKKFYVSALAGPDWSRVKAQKRDETGYSAGLRAGYNLTKKWAVEAGAVWAKKAYYSEGEYFKPDKLYLPQHSTIIQVDGYCAMVEIPVNLRYNAVRKRGSVLFAAAGVSSYLMQKEDYNYVYKRYNNYYSGNKIYEKASKNWWSVVNISVGYERRIFKATSIRIEPYVGLPLKGVGIGSLPLTSTGVLVGITHPVR